MQLEEADRLRLLDRIDEYCDAVPRAGAMAERFGTCSLFVGAGAWTYYIRPARGAARIEPIDLSRALQRQAALGLDAAVEWVDELVEGVDDAVVANALVTVEYPLLVRVADVRQVTAPIPAGHRIEILDADSAWLREALATQSIAFSVGGVEPGTTEPGELAAALERVSASEVDHVATRIAEGRTIVAAALDEHEQIVAAGMCQPVRDVAEIVGVATLPIARRRGIAGALSDRLAREVAGLGVEVVFLSAASDPVAQVYERIGFERVGVAKAASRS